VGFKVLAAPYYLKPLDNFYRCAVRLATIKVFHLPTDALYISLITTKIYIET